MGTCSSTGMSRQFTLDELADLPVGGIREMGNGCGPGIEGTQGGGGYDRLKSRGFGWPDNGEFNWGGLGSSCAMCSEVGNGYGCDNCGGAQAIGGNRGTVKRIAYGADPGACCRSNGSKILNGKTCDPRYRNYTGTDCDDPMLTYCNPNNWGTQECRAWTQAVITSGRTVPNVALSNYCSLGNNFAKPECQEWCSIVRNNRSMRSACDASSINYCKNNPTDPLCTCANPPPTITKIQDLMANAKVCWYKPCQTLSNDNYITSTMADQKKSCVSTACLIDAGNVSISGSNNVVKFDNSCATNLLKPEYQNAPVIPVTPVTSEGTSNSLPISTTTIILIYLFCLCLLILTIGIYLYVTKIKK